MVTGLLTVFAARAMAEDEAPLTEVRLQSTTLLNLLRLSARATSAMAPALCSALPVRSELDHSLANAA